ncbi:family 2 encapsulin nanocompartment cargo protein terpene cyclase [Pendulispora albinea]|uniref:Terpene synthase n=1 Tax=Pendulispora albinea TaxID=2741071 RepID=A0ABZ2MBK0_9BACT
MSTLLMHGAARDEGLFASSLVSDMRRAPPVALSELFTLVTGDHAQKSEKAPSILGPIGLGTSAARVVRAAHGEAAPIKPTKPSTSPNAFGAPGAPAITGPRGLGGLGTSAARLVRSAQEQAAAADGGEPLSKLELSARWVSPHQPESPELFCPGPVRDDPALGQLVNDQLVAWADQMGIYHGQLDHLRKCDFGRLMMLTHPATNDPDRLLAAAKVVVAEWASDDYYLDEEKLGADPTKAAARFGLLYGVVDPVALPVKYAPQVDEYIASHPIARAFRSGMEHLARYTTIAQLGRFQHQMAILFTTLDQNASWRLTGEHPSVWEYLVHRQHNSYLPPMILVDPIAGYELLPHEFYHPGVRRAVLMIGLAAVLINDIHSAAKESDDDLSLPEAIVAEEKCTHREAIARTVEIHNELMRAFVAEAGALSLAGSPNLRRFFADLWAWCGGSRQWHATTLRYHSNDAKQSADKPHQADSPAPTDTRSGS